MTVEDSIRAVRVTAAVLCVFGATVLGWQFYRFLTIFPGPAILAAVLELPLLLVGFLLLRLLHPLRAPPLMWSAAAVVWGATAATGCALLANQGLTSLWAKGAGVRFAARWSASLTAPFNEEIFKACGVVMIVLAAPLVLRGPLDGMVYGALTGLGFQAVENVTYGLNNILLNGAVNPGHAVISSMVLRVGSTALGSHWTMTAVAGAGIGYLVWYVRGRGSPLPGLGCLAAAVAMHVLFDAPDLSLPVKVTINLVAVTSLYLLVSNAYLARARLALASGTVPGLSPPERATALRRWQRLRQLRQVATQGERTRLQARQRDVLAKIDAEVS